MAREVKALGLMGTPYVREAVQGWLDYITIERQLADHTSEAYARDVSQFLAFLASHLNRLPDIGFQGGLHLNYFANIREANLARQLHILRLLD